MLLRLILSFVLFFQGVHAQQDSLRNRKIILYTGTAVLGAGSLIGLNQAWYKPYSTGKFHFFDDNKEWMQMDKVGHVFTCYHLARMVIQGSEKAGLSQSATYWFGAGSGFLYMSAIEVMDGFSSGWGYSWGDQLADAVGTVAALAQYRYWREQRFQLKFSFARSGLAKYNPKLLGAGLNEQLLKDYNGQTYWLSVNLASVFKSKALPSWLNLSMGYGAWGMLGGHSNAILAQDPNGNVWHIERQRRYYLSLDIDLSKLPVKNHFLRSLCSWLQIVKVPAPTLQFSKSGLRAYAIYF